MEAKVMEYVNVINVAVTLCAVCTCVFHVGGGVSISHWINIHKLLLKDRQQEGETVVQANIEDELMESRDRVA